MSRMVKKSSTRDVFEIAFVTFIFDQIFTPDPPQEYLKK
jgi:hypothetical protein